MYWVSFIRLGTGMPARQVATVSAVTPIGVLHECSSPAQIGSSYVITGHCLIWCHVRGSGEYLSPDWCLFYSRKKAELREHIRRRLTKVGELCACCQVSSRSKHHGRWRGRVMWKLRTVKIIRYGSLDLPNWAFEPGRHFYIIKFNVQKVPRSAHTGYFYVFL